MIVFFFLSVWSPTSKRANLRLNCNIQTTRNEMPAQIQPVTPPKAANTKEDNNKEEENSPVWQPFGAPYDGPPQFRPIKLGLTQTKTTTTTLSHVKSKSYCFSFIRKMTRMLGRNQINGDLDVRYNCHRPCFFQTKLFFNVMVIFLLLTEETLYA